MTSARGKLSEQQVQKAVRMRVLSFVIIALCFSQAHYCHAQDFDDLDTTIEDPTDGDEIPEPVLADYHEATRTPGFSPIYDVVDHI